MQCERVPLSLACALLESGGAEDEGERTRNTQVWLQLLRLSHRLDQHIEHVYHTIVLSHLF
jgi:hypothetical protein